MAENARTLECPWARSHRGSGARGKRSRSSRAVCAGRSHGRNHVDEPSTHGPRRRPVRPGAPPRRAQRGAALRRRGARAGWPRALGDAAERRRSPAAASRRALGRRFKVIVGVSVLVLVAGATVSGPRRGQGSPRTPPSPAVAALRSAHASTAPERSTLAAPEGAILAAPGGAVIARPTRLCRPFGVSVRTFAGAPRRAIARPARRRLRTATTKVLANEVALVQQAAQALARRDAVGALAILDAYDHQWPHGALAEEAGRCAWKRSPAPIDSRRHEPSRARSSTPIRRECLPHAFAACSRGRTTPMRAETRSRVLRRAFLCSAPCLRGSAAGSSRYPSRFRPTLRRKAPSAHAAARPRRSRVSPASSRT